MVLTEEQQTNAYPVASLETATLNAEKIVYNIPDAASVRVNKSSVSGYPTDTYTNPNDFIHKLNGNGTKVGTSIVLKVMAGDKFNVRANSWYKLNGATPQTPVNPLNDLLTALITGVASTGKAAITELTNSGVLTPGMQNFLNNQTYNSSKPKAYLNWVLFDEQLKFVSNGSGFEQVGNDNIFTTHLFNNLPVTKNGFLYIYVSNETPNIDVFFDNLQVTHIRGPILEETHYYPFGLVMQGISSKAANTLQNRYKYNGGNELQSAEFSDNSGLEVYDAVNRMYDPQIGRFWQIDELAESNWEWSPYFFANNNPILFNDPFGLDPETSTPEKPKQLTEIVIISTKKMSYWAKMNMMYDLQKRTNGDLNRIVSPDLRYEMLRLQDHSNFRQRVADMTRESDKVALEVGSWLLPVGWLTKLRYVKLATNLLKFKRGEKAAYSIYSYITRKIANQMAARGWTKEAIHELVNNPYTIRESVNLATGHAATAYFEKSGAYVVKDNVSKEIIQISDKLREWIVDKNIINPYIPK